MIVADFIVDRLIQEGVRHVFGVGGANIEDLFAAVQRRRPLIRAVLGKHEHASGTAADAYARLGGGVGVVLATSGGGALNLVHSLAEAKASNSSVLAIAGDPPSELQGYGAFQDTSGLGAVDALEVFRAVSVRAERAESAADVPELLCDLLRTARAAPGPAVLLVSKDRQNAELGPPRDVRPTPLPVARALSPDPEAIEQATAFCQRRPLLVIAGDEVARSGSRPELARLVEALDARVAVTPDGRDAFDNRSPRFLGVTGAMGHDLVNPAALAAAGFLLIGTRLPFLSRLGLESVLRDKPVLSVGREPPFLALARLEHLPGRLSESLDALSSRLGASPALLSETPRTVEPPPRTSVRDDGAALDSESALRMIERRLPEGSVVVVDAGNTGAQAVHHLRVPRDGRWLLALGMAGMGYAFGAAVGAACATGARCTVIAGDGAFYMHGLDLHTAVEHELPITYVVFNNRAHGMCLVRERLLLGYESEYNDFRVAHLGAGLGRMFPGLLACDCSNLAELERALALAAERRGPSLIALELAEVEVPPFLAFRGRAPRGRR